MLVTRFSQMLQEEFYKRLERKTEWGKEEIKREYELSKVKVVTELLDESVKEDEKNLRSSLR